MFLASPNVIYDPREADNERNCLRWRFAAFLALIFSSLSLEQTFFNLNIHRHSVCTIHGHPRQKIKRKTLVDPVSCHQQTGRSIRSSRQYRASKHRQIMCVCMYVCARHNTTTLKKPACRWSVALMIVYVDSLFWSRLAQGA